MGRQGLKPNGSSSRLHTRAKMRRVFPLWLAPPVLLSHRPWLLLTSWLCFCHTVTFPWLLQAACGSQHSSCLGDHGLAARSHLSWVSVTCTQPPGGFPLSITCLGDAPSTGESHQSILLTLQICRWEDGLDCVSTVLKGKRTQMKSCLTLGMPQNDETKQHQGITERCICAENQGGDRGKIQIMEEKGCCCPRPVAVVVGLQLGGECKAYMCVATAKIPGCDPLLWVPGAHTHISMASLLRHQCSQSGSELGWSTRLMWPRTSKTCVRSSDVRAVGMHRPSWHLYRQRQS